MVRNNAARATIRFDLASRAAVELDIFDVEGRHVRRLAAGTFEVGPHAFSWDGRSQQGALQPSGVYFYRLVVDGAVAVTRRMVLLK